jgi:hypothetical protein
VQKEIDYDPGCELPHIPSAGTKTASFALVSRGPDPDMTSLLLLRMYYVSYTLLCIILILIIHQVCMQHRYTP